MFTQDLKSKFISLGICCLASSSFIPSALAVDSMQLSTFSDFDIISANKLNYSEKETIMTGGVKIRFGSFIITAPEVVIKTDTDSSPQVIEFLGNVNLESKELNIQSEVIEIDFKTNLFKAYSKNKQVLSTIYGDEKMTISSDYQDYNLKTGLAHAQSNSKDPVIFKSKDRTIYAQENELKYKQGEESELEFISFKNDVISIEKDRRIEAQELLYLTKLDQIKAFGEVKIAYESKDRGLIHLFADSVIYENTIDLLSAFSQGSSANVSIYAENMFGKARQLIMQQANSQKSSKAVLSGSAYAQLDNKAIDGDEILFDIKNQEIITLVGRPSSKLLSAE